MFHNSGSGLDSIKRFASLAKVCGKSSIAGVQSIQTELSGSTPASPAVLPSGTLKDTQEPLRDERGMAMVGTTP
jgi:hypothetical protein